ncbi:MAG: alpha/beta fold hydrolase [Armatimonadota bacterium]
MPTIDIDGEQFDYTDTGNGVAVVFLAGLCGSKDWFCYQSAGLGDRFRVIATCLRPAGNTAYTLDSLVRDVARFLERLRVHNAVIAGHSLGGMVALSFALAYADRCLAVVLSSTAPTYGSVSEDQLVSDLMVGKLRPGGFLARLGRRLFGSDRPKEDLSDPLAYLASHNGGIDRATLQARLRLMRETDLTERLGEVSLPVLIVAGAQEQPYALAGSQALDQGLPDSSLEIIEGADQFHFFFAHDQFNEAVADFLLHKVTRP